LIGYYFHNNNLQISQSDCSILFWLRHPGDLYN